MRRILIALSTLTLLAVAGCAGGSATGSQATPSTAPTSVSGLTVTGDFGTEPTVTVSGVDETTTQSAVLIKGDGPVVAQGSKALLDIYLANATTGAKAVSTWDQGAPSSVTLAQGSVFPQFINALTGVSVGSRVVLVAPVTDLWGEQGDSQLGLAPADAAIFVFDVLSTPDGSPLSGPQGNDQTLPSGMPTPVMDSGKVTSVDFSAASKTPPTGLQVVTLVKGTGAPVRKATYITVNYYGVVWGGTTAFDESYSKAPITFDVGDGHLIKAWDEGLIGVTAGSRVMIIAPPTYGYGSTAQASIPANSTLVFIVDVLGVG